VELDFEEFTARHSALIGRAYEESGAARWNLPLHVFAEAIYKSICDATAGYDPAGTVHMLRVGDLALAVACREGIASAWEHFVREYGPVLYGAARAMAADDGQARELADSLYADLYGIEVREGRRRSLLNYFQGRSSLRTWLKAVLAQRHVDSLREAQRTIPIGDGYDAVDFASNEPAEPDRDRYLEVIGAALDYAIAALDARDRMRLGYYYRHGLKLRQIGKIMGESESKVSRCLERTRRALRTEIERALISKHRLSREQIRLCYDYAAEALPLDLGRLLRGAG